MVKFIIYCVKGIAVALSAILLSSCNGNIYYGKTIKGSGNVITQTREVSEFEKIKVCCGLECEITQGEQFSVTVEADDNLINDIETKVKNNTLIISTDYNNYERVKARKVKVTLPKITSIKASSGSLVTTTNTISGTNSTFDTSSGSKMKLDVEIDTIYAESSSGSSLNIKGKALELFTNSSSGSTINAGSLLVNVVTAKSSSGSSTEVYPILSLKAKSSSGSSITYTNTPKELTIDESSGGNVSKD